MSIAVDYPRLTYEAQQHHKRFVRRVTTTDDSMLCQDCCGYGGYIEVVLDDGSGPWLECYWCEGTGKTTKWLRGLWLRYKKM